MRVPGVSLIGMALGSFAERPFRTILTMLGIIIGVTAVFVSLSLGEGGKEKIRENLDSVSARTMSIFPNWTGRSSRQRPWRPFTESDVLEIQPYIADQECLSPHRHRCKSEALIPPI